MLPPSAVLPASSKREARASPTVKLRKDGGLPPVTTEKPLLLEFLWRELVEQCPFLIMINLEKRYGRKIKGSI
jgi:hypothetical protein